MNLPKNYQTVMPYLIIKNASDFILFVQKVFGGEEIFKTMHDEHVIMHAEVKIGESTIMLAEATGEHKTYPAGLFVYVDNADEAYKKALDAGATKVTELSNQNYGRSGGVADPFGNVWWITSLL